MFFTETQPNEIAWTMDTMKAVKSLDTEPIGDVIGLPPTQTSSAQGNHFELHSIAKRLSSSGVSSSGVSSSGVSSSGVSNGGEGQANDVNVNESESAEQIKLQIQAQADIVRRSFESSSKRKTTSAATKAAAASMASANMRKRQKMTSLFPPAAQELFSSAYPASAPTQQTSVRVANRFFSPIASVTTAMPKEGPSTALKSKARLPSSSRARSAPLSKDGEARINTLIRSMSRYNTAMSLNSHPHTIYITNNDIICGKGPVTNNMVGNRRYCVLVDLHLHSFKKAASKVEREAVARSVVHTVRQSVPSGKFLALDVDSGLWADVGDERATANTLKELAMRSPPVAPPQIRLADPNKTRERRGGVPRAA